MKIQMSRAEKVEQALVAVPWGFQKGRQFR